MLAGSFIGPVGALTVRSPAPTVVGRSGSGVRQSIADQYLRQAGLGGRGGLRVGRLGDGVNFCTDPGWQAAQAIIGIGGAVIAGAGAAASDSGWTAVGTTTAGVAGAWAAQCAAQTRAGGTTTPSAGTTSSAAAAQQAALAAQQASLAQDQIRIAREQQQRAEQDRQRNTMILVAGGVAVAAIGAFLILR